MSTLKTVDLAPTHDSIDYLLNDDETEKEERCDSQPSAPPKSNSISQSSWAYLKWFVWVAVSGLFNCGTSVLEAAFDYRWSTSDQSVANSNVEASNPISVTSERSETKPTDKSLVCAELTEEDIQLEECFLLENSNNLLDSKKHLDLSPLNGLLHSKELEQHVTYTTPTWYTEELYSPGFTNCDQSDKSFTPPGSFTLLNSLYAESENGTIDEATRDLFVSELLQSVIPRNLSDSSEVTVTPSIRKMYAWTDPSSYPNDSGTDEPYKKHSSDIESCGSDLQFAYPGKLTMSDSSFSPLSPGTAESNTPTGERSQTPSDLGLPDIDRQDQTLAWARSNLKVSPEMRTELDQLGASSEPAARVSSGRTSFPTCRERQSRERSPVTTINSARLADTLSLPTFVPFEGRQMFNETPIGECEDEIPKPKRSSSLKSTRTPPGTPGQKAVRFADALGLDLATVRHVFDQENPPKIPASATFDLQLDSDECIAKLGAKQFGLCFAQPGAASNFIRRVLNETVCLEDCHVDMPRGVLTGTIRVKSLGFEKHIVVRITYNNWVTFFDTQASYVQGSHDGATDRFSFSVVFPDTMVPGDRAQFAIRYDTHTGEQFWDNNHGQNYSVTCYAKATDLAGDGSWVHYL